MKRRIEIYSNKNISGEIIKQERENKKLSRQDLANKLQLEGFDFSAPIIANIENDLRTVIDSELLIFAKILNFSIILNGDNRDSKKREYYL